MNTKRLAWMIGMMCLVLAGMFSVRPDARLTAFAGETAYLYQGGGEEEVVFSRPSQFAAPSAEQAVRLLTAPDMDGSEFFYERGLDCFVLKGYTGYLYGAVNLTFSNPIPDADLVKSMQIELKAEIYHDFDYDDIIYFNDKNDSVTIPYFRLHAVDEDGSVHSDTFFSFHTRNVPRQKERLTVTLSPREIRKLKNSDGGIETLQWSVFTNSSTYFGFSYFSIYEISYELFGAEDYHTVSFFDGETKLTDQRTAYTVTPPEGMIRPGYRAVWKDKSGKVFDFETPVTENCSLFLEWQVEPCTLSFRTNGGSSVDPIVADYGSVIQRPADPIRSGYSFAGWYEDEECTIPYVFEKMGEDRTVYAKWTPQLSSPEDAGGGCSATASVSNFSLALGMIFTGLGIGIMRSFRRKKQS